MSAFFFAVRLGLIAVLFLATAGASDASMKPRKPAVEAIPAAAIAAISRDDYLVLAQGCVPIPGDNGQACLNPPQVDLHNPLELLRQGLCMTTAQFEAWSAAHVQFVRARNSDSGPVQQAVTALNVQSGSIFLIGHSAGGAAIVNYLLAVKQGTLPAAGIRGAYILDSPLARENLMQLIAAQWAGFSSSDRLAGLGAWAAQHNIDLEVISYADDWVINPIGEVADIRQRLVSGNPTYHVGPWELMLKHNYALFDFNGTRDFLGSILAARECQT